ncbi:unnamed protein product [Brachionus calyciflorus]|uniref:MRH domain-containing protein n=1 Tax=Brachionus calyciflorus TaxID=104777 RepID=A0A813MVL6_9BILA|nr:unnamed protein product [Brachionus calyciflorus]
MKLQICFLVIFLVVNSAQSDPIPSNSTTNSSDGTTTISPQTTTPSPKLATGCELSKSSQHEKQLLTKINQLKDKNFQFEDNEHKYFFSICSKAQNANQTNEALVQMNKKTNKTFVLGRLDDVDLESATNLIRISYNNGDNYANACNKNERNAVIYLICDRNKVNPEFRLIEENNNRDNECAYIFELLTPEVCDLNTITTTLSPQQTTVTTSTEKISSGDKKSNKLGVVPVILIVLFSLMGVYFIVGTLYMRFVKRASGWEQIPNFGFWSAIGDGSADLCNFLCRCGNRHTEIHTYENINDRLSDDENLLNM